MTFPGVHKTYEADFGQWRTRLHFLSNQTAQVESLTTGHEETVEVCILAEGHGIYSVCWIERDSTVVLHVQNHETGQVTCFSTKHRGMQYRRGTFREVQA